MILSLYLEENYTFGSLIISFDFESKKLIYIKNNNVLKEETLNIDVYKFREFLNSYIIHWDNSYIDNNVIDGKNTNLKIYTDTEMIEYNFKNKFPHDYSEFLQILKEKVGIYE